jgi:3',5'-cyclic AMP phosphodiesterase CpdA
MRNIGVIALSAVLIFAATVSGGQDQQIAQRLAALAKIGPRFSFAVIGDNRSGDDVYRKIVTIAVARKPDFIVNTGDMIATPGDRKQWATFWEMSRPIAMPYFLTVGNHDIHPEVKGSEETYKEQVDLPGNELFYSFAAGNSLFIILDSSVKGEEKKITGEQLKWLEGVLAGSRHKNKFVFVHHPLYPEPGRGRHHGNSLDRYKRDRDRLQSVFRKYGVAMVFNGHEHLYLRKSVEGIPHIITGGGGAPLYAAEDQGGFYHFIAVTVDGDRVTAEVVDINGKVRDGF